MRSLLRWALAGSLLLLPLVSHAYDFKMKASNVPVTKITREITRQTGLVFSYGKSLGAEVVPSVNVNLKDVTPQVILEKVFRGTDIGFRIEGEMVYLVNVAKPDPVVIKETVPPPSQPQPQSKQVSLKAKVMDRSGEPLAGAAALLVHNGKSYGATADLDGEMEILVPEGIAPTDRVTFSFLGFSDETQQVGGRSRIEVVLRDDSQLLSESVVVGYGVQKKENLTGAVSVVDGSALESRSSSSLAGMISGSMPNVTIKTTSGRAGGSSTLNIRGVNTISSSQGPLILIDGVEGNLENLNPNDVESISVLKDASAAAVYGARAGFGVMLITTKLPKEETSTVRYSGKFGFGDVTTSTDFETRGYYHAYIVDKFYRTYQGTNYTTYTPEDYHELWIRRNDKKEDPSRPWVVEKDGQYKYYGNFDWYNYFFDDRRPTWEHNISVSGGSKKIHYMISGNFYTQKGSVRIQPDRFKRFTVRSRVSADVKPWLTISNNTSFYYNSYTFPGQTANGIYVSASHHALSSEVPINPDGSLTWATPVNAGGYKVAQGLSALLTYGKNRNEESDRDFRTTLEAVGHIGKYVNITGNYSFSRLDEHTTNRNVTVPVSDVPGEYTTIPDTSQPNNLAEYFNSVTRHSANVYATWEQTFNRQHAVKLMGGANYEIKRYKNNNFSRDGLQSEDLDDFRLATGENMSVKGSQNHYALLGFFYRGNYAFKDRYLFEASGRYDGSSRFARGHRFGFFPSFSAGWRMSEEPFWAKVKPVVNNAKLRLSYGSLGNQGGVDYYATIQTITTGTSSYLFGDGNLMSYAYESAPNASDLTWETVVTYNAGLDLGMFKGRFNLTGDLYIRDTKDMLMDGMALPATYGADPPQMNAADMRTYGWELSLSWNDTRQVLGSPLHYYVNAGLGDNVSYVTKYDNPNQTLTDPYKGMKLGDIWGYRIDGYFLSDYEARSWEIDQSYVNGMINSEVIDNGIHAGDLKFRDLDGNGKIEPTTSALAENKKDTEVIGNSLPRLNYSLTLGMDWKGVDFSMMLQGVGHQDWYPGVTSYFWGPYGRPFKSFIPSNWMEDVWSEDNPDAYYPRPRGYVAHSGGGGVRELVAVNDRYLQNVGFLRLKNLTLGYTLPMKWTSKAGMDRVRLYFSGENLCVFSPLHSKYIDPEQAGAALGWKTFRADVVGYPYSKSFTFGIDITF